LRALSILTVNAAKTLVVAAFLFCAIHARAQSPQYPALKVVRLGAHALLLTITNGFNGGSYDIIWTPVLGNTVKYPWRQIAAGSPSQTNFVINGGIYQPGFFAARVIPSWEVNSGTVAWWRANQIGLQNGAAVTNWIDIYGNVLQGAASFDTTGMNGYPSVDFNSGANNALSNSVVLANHSSLTNCGALFVMFAWPHPPTQPDGEAILSCDASNNAEWFILSPTISSPTGFIFLEDGWSYNGSGCAGNIVFDSLPGDDEHLFLTTWTNGVWQDYLDGKLVDNYPSGGHRTTPVFPVALTGMLTVGNTYDHGWPYQGSVSEIGIATNYWNFQTVDQASGYILKASDMVRPTIVLHGDSMMLGGNGSYLGGLMDYISTNFPGWTIDNCAILGQGSADVRANFLYMASYTTAGTNKSIDIFWDNINLDGVTADENNLYADANAAAAYGKIPVLVIPPSNPGTDPDGERFLFENTMTNNPGAFQFICNLALNPNVGYSNAWTNAIYYFPVGGVHLTNAGNATISVDFISTIEQIISH
jgi:hypothetical protein